MPSQEYYFRNKERYLAYNRNHREYRHASYLKNERLLRQISKRLREEAVFERIQNGATWIDNRVAFAHREIMPSEDLLYAKVAMLIDGEGTVSLRTTRPRTSAKGRLYISPYVNVTNANPTITSFCTSAFHSIVRERDPRLGLGHVVNQRGNSPNRRDCTRWYVVGKASCVEVLSRVYPHLLIKKAQADIVFAFVKSRLSKKGKDPYSPAELEMVTAIRKLNQRGKKAWRTDGVTKVEHDIAEINRRLKT